MTSPAPRRFYTRWWCILPALLFGLGTVTAAVLYFFPQQTLGAAVRFVTDGPAPNAQEILHGELPAMSTIRDNQGQVLTYVYDQRRVPVADEDINQSAKDALIAIEDRRFYEHDGVDWKGVFRATVSNVTSDATQGASTITQQYVKNYTWLITAQTDEERDKAIAQTTSRKLTEIATAEDIDNALSKDEILTRYLNLVSFGHGSFGIEDAARTYFGIAAKDLTVPQSAMLAGMVQSPSYLDPYERGDEVIARRNVVLDAMVVAGTLDAGAAASAKQQPLGVLAEPDILPNGCSHLVVDGFFCDQVLADLSRQGITYEQLEHAGYDITTTLDRPAQDAAVAALKRNADPHAAGVAEAMTLINPDPEHREIIAMGSSRDYGLDESQQQTTLPLPSSLVGNGAGSVFKVFTAAQALEHGAGVNDTYPVPPRYEASGLGDGGADRCPPGKYCVENAGAYPPALSFHDLLAQSPNTPFVAMAEQLGNPSIVDAAVKMGLRSYTQGDPGNTFADQMRASGSFTLGPTPVSTAEMANVGATIASGGVWCEPTTLRALTQLGKEVALQHGPCEQAMDREAAAKLAHAMSHDTINGTARQAAAATGWGDRPVSAKTGTTDDNQSASFLAFTPELSGFVYAFNTDGNAPLCTAPLRQCDQGNIFGGNEPARTWMEATLPIIDQHGGAKLPAIDPNVLNKPSVTAQTASQLALHRDAMQAKAALESNGYAITEVTEITDPNLAEGTVTGVTLLTTNPHGGGTVRLDVVTRGKESAQPSTSRPTPRPRSRS